MQYGWGGITTITLNDADTTALSSALGYTAGAGIATLLGALAPADAVALGVVGGEARADQPADQGQPHPPPGCA